MRKGDLSRSRLSPGSPVRPIIRALVLASTVGLAGLLWQVWPFSPPASDLVTGAVRPVATRAAPVAAPPPPSMLAAMPSPRIARAPEPRAEPVPEAAVVPEAVAEPAPPVGAVAQPQPIVVASADADVLVPLPASDPLPPTALAFAAAEPRPAETAEADVPATTGGIVREAPAGRNKVAARTEPRDAASPKAAAGGIDLNKASLAELNGLRGAGLIGRAIVRGRPYASPEDLVRKRVVNRSTFNRIKGQVVVR